MYLKSVGCTSFIVLPCYIKMINSHHFGDFGNVCFQYFQLYTFVNLEIMKTPKAMEDQVVDHTAIHTG
jgi:hypothetical protein